MRFSVGGVVGPWCVLLVLTLATGWTQERPADPIRALQFQAMDQGKAAWGHWGARPDQYSSWTNHSNRLVPVYAWGTSLDEYTGSHSAYRSEQRLAEIYGAVPQATLNPKADYLDQTDIYRIQRAALAAGRKHVIVMIFDGMDWPTTQAAAVYQSQRIYESGRGSGLRFLEYRADESAYAAMVTSPHNGATRYDVDAQAVTTPVEEVQGGYSVELGGATPWSQPASLSYLISQNRSIPHVFTDSASSATSMYSGIKTYNGAINIDPQGRQVNPIAHDFQATGYSIGVVTNVPISHATPAAAYSHNVTRNDYQDLSRDLLGLVSSSHRDQPLAGVDVLIGGGWGEERDDDRSKQGANYVPGNKYLPEGSLEQIDVERGGRYQVVQRTAGADGGEILMAAAETAADQQRRLFGFFGTVGGHLPYRTADGDYQPTRGASSAERYEPADIEENPTLAEMTRAALTVLQRNPKGFWLSIEAGDVDWANHQNNLDDAIGAVLSGDEAFREVTEWVEANSNWDETILILTADHGHLLVLEDPSVLLAPSEVTTNEKE